MTAEVNLLLGVLAVLTGASQTRGQSSVPPPVSTLMAAIPNSPSPHLAAGPEWTNSGPATPQSVTVTRTQGTVQSETDGGQKTGLLTAGIAVSDVSPPPDVLSSTLAFHSPAPPRVTSTTFSSQPGVRAGSAPRSKSPPPTAGRPRTSAAGRDPTNRDVAPVLNVGDEDPERSSLDPLLAGLMSVFIVSTAIFSTVLFLRIRQRTAHPEFHRLPDLPMDDLMEDTPLSRSTY